MQGIHRLFPLFAISFSLSISLSATSHAATEFGDEIPAEVVTTVIGATFGGNTRLYTDAPEGFPPFAMPRGMSFLVGVDQGRMQRVILRSRVDYQASIALAYGVLLDAGWQLVPQPGSQPPQAGFIDPNQRSPQTQLCHDQYGILDVSANSGPGATYVTMNRNVQPGMPAQPCAQVLAGATPMPQNVPQDFLLRQQQRMLLQQYLPRLELPDTDGMSARRGNSGASGGSNNEWEIGTNLTGTWNIRRVYNHFAEQIEDQGWDRDTRDIGRSTASASWTKTVENAVELVGSLIVLKTGAESYNLQFRLVRVGDSEANVPALGIRGIAPVVSPIGVSEFVRD